MPDHADMLIQYLADRDVPCPRCGYNLRQLHGNRCPECGDAIELRIGLVEPRLGAYITLLASVCVGFGASTLLGLVALIEAPSRWWSDQPAGKILAVLWPITTLALPLVIALRRRCRRLGSGAQWAIALLALALVAACCTGIIMTFDD